MQAVLTYTRTRKSIHAKANIKIKRLQMSKEREAALRSAHKEREAAESEHNAMHTLWQSERKINLNGKWYVPISEVADILTAPTEEPDPLSEEWQAQTFPNLNIGNVDVSGMVESEPNDMELGGRIRAEYWKDRNRIPDRY